VGLENSEAGAPSAARGRRAAARRSGRLGARLRHDPVAAASAVFLVVVTVAAAFAPALAPHDPSAIIDRPQLGAGDIVTGPAIIQEFGSTVPVDPGYLATVDRYGNLIITRVDG